MPLRRGLTWDGLFVVMKLSTEYLRECFEYSEESPSGLIWKDRPLSHFKRKELFLRFNKNKKCGFNHLDKKGRNSWNVNLDGKRFLCHRIVYMLFNELLTSDELIDHIDGNPLNNCINNLRIASQKENLRNSKKRKSNTSGFKGVSKHRNKWLSYIGFNSKQIHLGRFDTPEEAHAAYCKASKELHGEFGRVA